MTVRVRRATAADHDDWYALRVAVAGEGIWIGAELPIPRNEPWFAARLEREDAADFLAVADGVIVGSIGVDVHGGVASLWMCVGASQRGRGVGRQLLDAGLAWAADVGAHKVMLEVWPHNGPAIALYRSAGFAVEGRKRRHYRRRNGELWDAILMGRVLDLDAPGSGLPDAEHERRDEPAERDR
jgi:ribosomal protein S18 acetylase RimI-like enzyme